jgi:hypothetical protein
MKWVPSRFLPQINHGDPDQQDPLSEEGSMFWLHAHVLPAKFDIFCIQRMDLHHHDCYCNPQVTEVANQMLCAHMFLSQINIRSGMPHNCTYIAQSFPALADVSLSLFYRHHSFLPQITQ